MTVARAGFEPRTFDEYIQIKLRLKHFHLPDVFNMYLHTDLNCTLHLVRGVGTWSHGWAGRCWSG